jgi:hypothetical protein
MYRLECLKNAPNRTELNSTLEERIARSTREGAGGRGWQERGVVLLGLIPLSSGVDSPQEA